MVISRCSTQPFRDATQRPVSVGRWRRGLGNTAVGDGLVPGERRGGFAEISARGRFGSENPVAPLRNVEIDFQKAVFAERLFQSLGQDDFAGLSEVGFLGLR